MSRKPVIITAAIVFFSVVFAMVFMSMNEEDINTAMTAFRGSTQETPAVKTETVIREVEERKGNATLAGIGTSSGDPSIFAPGLSGNVVVPDNLKDIIMMDFDSVYKLIVGTDDDAYSFDNLRHYNSTTEAALKNVQQKCAVSFEVPVWVWASSDKNDLTKVPSTTTVMCNQVIQPLAVAAFNDIYNSPDQPVIISAGGYSIRGMSNQGGGSSNTSGHAFGCVFDLNPSSMCNGKGNNMQKNQHLTPTYDEWQAMPECQEKYEIFYEGCTVVKVFKSYGFYWGGNWSTSTDGMHFGFLGDNGKNGRKDGQAAYAQYAGSN